LLVPVVLGAGLTVALIAACFVLQAGLRRPSAAEQLAAQVVSHVERIHSTRTIELVRGLHSVDTLCVFRSRSDHLSLGRRIRYTIVGTTAKAAGGSAGPELYVSAQADLAACPRLIANELSGRLLAGAPVHLYATGYARLRAYMLRINNRPPFVWLFVRRSTLAPLAVEFLGKRVRGFSRIVAVTLRRAPRPADRL
jgi:hypothetical protein